MKNIIKKTIHFANTWPGTILIVLSIIFFIAQAFVIPSGSMKGTLLIGDMLFVKKFAYGIPTPRIPWLEVKVLPDFDGDGHLIKADGPKRGDIVVFRYPHNEKIHYVKRCVAVGGDLVMLINKHLLIHPNEGNEYVKNHYPEQQIKEFLGTLWILDPYRAKHKGIHNDTNITPSNSYPEIFNLNPIKVPQNEYFMMGDNRDHSNDSRFWGTVPYKYIVGKPWFIHFSWDANKKIRWERVFSTVQTLEQNIKSNDTAHHKKGIY